ncbi:Crp/Fnr family transcriptional regulator [Larkinella sp. VNQ87]|uniref:Crp/Fnr family transcriptional regulator n=1 Tax=Larkinella sp. VNQ87 TaxID=3400921 RepID=UPI003BFAA3AC
MEKVRQIMGELGLSDTDCAAVCARFKRREYAKNDFLVRPEQLVTSLFFIEKGSVILGNCLNDRSVTRHLAKENEFITILSGFVNQTATAEFLKATEPTQVYALSKPDFDAVLVRFPILEQFYHRFIFETLEKCQQRIRDLISLDARAYYEEILRTNPDYFQKMPQYDLASYMGIEPQSLSRLRKAKR